MDIINIIFALTSIGLGCFGWLAPRYTLETLDLTSGPSQMGPSEIRASAGCLFVGMGLGALILGSAEAYIMLGFCWAGAATGRLTSLILDGQSKKKWVFFVVEAAVGLLALSLNV
ncbi:DUF4345 family protein [Yoonia sediminilitoris]|uniref:Uncharacterized protein DUF4345 n=1 Tax=Yoonia sediminilitoris TaxID=1286148 RepID=A0A2T6K975_9RHOB|nr:DUF4345 family protein [Yoonia sediminilitoris]PUB11301.1 uncharacterized protein DUF4345 [Yoonia sediminilitoris]RCW91117.1 uncharacterized protein DUF4345 [Yoonia sediminilitoris]